jgi:hypothetical protein
MGTRQPDNNEVRRQQCSAFEKSRHEVSGHSAECECPRRHVNLSQAHLITNVDAHYLDNNRLWANSSSAETARPFAP